ncbi:TlpA family protein disulfide reductase [Sphingobacterium faecale]|uniref:TlpA family protein disulfide reductase n=1 Tax=Sphingobacterium faecale TaxID=2803775 RepID=A0ABS1R700_9SPHI|nr:TlpA disulfide reductase family protein [Sphingobacterium faecale]MBL1410433.1 TlpA family protein disulfide reductase [Sphingobacterium faecale]
MTKTCFNLALTVLLLLIAGSTGFAQRKTNLSLSFNGQYAQNDFKIIINDGINGFDVDSIVNNKVLVNREIFAPYAHISITYKGGQSYDYLIGTAPAQINMNIKRDIDGMERLDCSAVNADRIMDPTTSPMYAGLLQVRKEHGEPISSFWQEHGNTFMRSDSLKHKYVDIIKPFNSITINYLKDYPDDYFSFWFFKTQVLDASNIIAKAAPDYVEYLISFMLETFPQQYTTSENVTYSIESLRASKEAPIQVGEFAPGFEMVDYNGNIISLKNLRGKLVLLDFWASWCGPCIAQIPDIKKLTTRFHIDDLEVIGISLDRDQNDFRNATIQHEMTWRHILDHRKKLSNLYRISVVPTLLLIDREGKIIFKNDKGYGINKLQKIITANLSKN